MKRLARVLGVDDGHFSRRGGRVPLVGVLMRGPVVEAVFVRHATVDGTDATDAILSMLSTEAGRQVRLLFLNGAAVAGTNVVDPDALPVPYVSVVRRRPTDAFFSALLRSPFGEEKARLARKYVWRQVETERGKIWVSTNAPEGINFLRAYQINSAFPEPLRLAHLIASAMTLGDSRGRP